MLGKNITGVDAGGGAAGAKVALRDDSLSIAEEAGNHAGIVDGEFVLQVGDGKGDAALGTIDDTSLFHQPANAQGAVSVKRRFQTFFDQLGGGIEKNHIVAEGIKDSGSRRCHDQQTK